MAPRMTVKDLRAEARRRLLHCGNGKTISRMNKKELITFLDCIAGSKNVHASRVADKVRRDTATTEQVSVGNLFSAPRRKKKRVHARPIRSSRTRTMRTGHSVVQGSHRHTASSLRQCYHTYVRRASLPKPQ